MPERILQVVNAGGNVIFTKHLGPDELIRVDEFTVQIEQAPPPAEEPTPLTRWSEGGC